MIRIELANCQQVVPVDTARLHAAAHAILTELGPAEVELSLTIVDSSAMHELNRQYLQHDYPTDVLSFPLVQTAARLEAEVIVNAELAAEVAPEYQWSTGNELLLYAVHGTLHLVGLDDHSPADRTAMRAAERRFMRQFGEPHGDMACERA